MQGENFIMLKRHKRNSQAYLWMLPAFVIVSFSTVYPLIFSIDYSLWQSKRFTKISFNWFNNYITLFQDSRFWDSLARTLYFAALGVIITTVLGFILALLLREGTRTNTIYRTIILIPWVTNEIAFSLMWAWVLNPQTSPLYYLSTQYGLILPNFLNDPKYALTTLAIINGLRAVGFSLVMMLAAFAMIPKEIEQAAEVDGCYGLKNIWHIYIPMIKPVGMIVIIVLTISYFNIIGLVLFITGGGPIRSTELLSVRLYREGFTYFNISLASTMTTIVLSINLVLAWIYKRMMNAETPY